MSYTRQELPSELASPEPFNFIPTPFSEPEVEVDESLPPQPTDATEEEMEAWDTEQLSIGDRNGDRSQARVERIKRKIAHGKAERIREREEKKEWEKREEEWKKKVEEWNPSEDRKAKEWEEEERRKTADAEKRKTEKAEREQTKLEAAGPKGKGKASEGATDPKEPQTTEPDGEEELDGKRVFRMPEAETGDCKPGLAEMYEQGKKDGEIVGFELMLAAGALGKKARGGGGGKSKKKFSEGSVACKRCEDANKTCYLAIPTAESTTSACCSCANSKQRCLWSAVPPAASDAGASNSALVGLMGEMVREMRKIRRGMVFYYGTKFTGEPSDAEEDDEDEEEGEVKIPAPGKPLDSPRWTVKRLIPFVEIPKSPVTCRTAAAKRKAGEDEGEAGQLGPSEQPKKKKKVNPKSTETVESEPEERGEVDKSKEKSKKGGK
ncbi:hypothetical protein V5O48_014293 [Marasmius crinis-equi]|uniref:Zn(2)-C6 fungal-type domain-containing protein n=1 Tax=Marasmius crinis-equi TaxID=585013 RepID=A0ABR3EY22_9AGAR